MKGNSAMGAVHKDRRRQLILLLIPSVILIAIFIIIPLFFVFGLSFFRFSLLEPWKNGFTGLQNYINLVMDDRFWNSLKVAGILGVSKVALQIFFGLALSLLLHSKIPGSKSTRTLFILPMTIPPIVGSVMWKLLFNPTVPGINYVLSWFGISGPIWFETPLLALSPIIIANVWQFMPFVMLMLLAALESLPTDPFESAAIDGANNFQIFFPYHRFLYYR
jgi:multiple sugar transport system permease protein